MSMLAEPRRRQKWTLNPRGNTWAKDDSKFGQKLMEKMGWSKGKGLGADEQGRIDPISVRHKDDNKGVGYAGHDDVWLDHQKHFDDLLANLNQNQDEQDQTIKPAESLEEASRRGRKRLHYKKFTKGKDTSRYSEADLNCILGTEKKNKKRKMEMPEEESVESAIVAFSSQTTSNTDDSTEETSNDTSTADNFMGFQTSNKGSMNSYFEKKMAMAMAKLSKTGNTVGAGDVEGQQRPGDEMDASMTSSDAGAQPPELQLAVDEEVPSVKSKKKKKSKSCADLDQCKEDAPLDDSAVPSDEVDKSEDQKGKRKKKTKQPICDGDSGDVGAPESVSSKDLKEPEAADAEPIRKKCKKKSKSKSRDEDGCEEDQEPPAKSDKTKRKRSEDSSGSKSSKKCHSEESESIANPDISQKDPVQPALDADEAATDRKERKKKKKKNKKEAHLEVQAADNVPEDKVAVPVQGGQVDPKQDGPSKDDEFCAKIGFKGSSILHIKGYGHH